MKDSFIVEPEWDWTAKERDALAVIDEAIAEYKPKRVYALFSGGNDSNAMLHIAVKHPAVDEIIHIDTGTGIQETQAFVVEAAERLGKPLQIIKSHVSFEELVARYGFLGSAKHNVYYNALKGRALRRLAQEACRPDEKVLFITGVRKQESARRKINVSSPVQDDRFEKRWVWASIIHDWSKLDCRAYLDHIGAPTNPVSDLIHMSGECLCGAFGSKEELDEIRMWYPQAAERIDEFAAIAKANNRWSGWGEPVPSWFDASLDSESLESFGVQCGEDDMLCQSCPNKEVGA